MEQQPLTASLLKQSLLFFAASIPAWLLAASAGADPALLVYRCAIAESASTETISGEEILARQPEKVRRALGKRGFSSPAALATSEVECQGFIQAIVVFEQPRQKTLELLAQTHRQMEFLPNLRNVRSVARHENESLDHHEIKIIFTKLEYRVRNHWSHEEWTMWWHLEPGYANDMASLDGYWRFYELADGGTVAIYASRIDVGPYLPASLQASLSRKKLEESLRHFRSWVNSGGSYRP